VEITVPINSLRDMEALADLGAKEFYCGLPPVDVSTVVNRQDAYLLSEQEARAVTAFANRNRLRIFYTLNMYYAPQVLPMVLDQLDRMTDSGSFGLIVSDVSLMADLHDRLPELELVASVMGHALNGEAVRFYREAGCKRVILGTHLSEGELEALVSDCRSTAELEALVLNSGCYYEDGFCAFEHRLLTTLSRESALKSAMRKSVANALDRGPRAARRIAYAFGPDRNPCCLRPGEIRILAGEKQRSRELERAAYSLLSLERFKHKCGLCALRRLDRAGLAAVKIVGREKTLSEKKSDFLTVRSALKILRKASDEKEYREHCLRLFQRRNGFDCGRAFCYYRDDDARV